VSRSMIATCRSIPAAIVSLAVIATLVSGCALARKLDEGRDTDLRIECWVPDPADPDGERVMEMLEAAECRDRDGRVR